MKLHRSVPMLIGSLTLVVGACVPNPAPGGTTTSTTAPSSTSTTSTSTTTTTTPTVPTLPMSRAQMLDYATSTLHRLFDHTMWAPELAQVSISIVDMPDSDGIAYCPGNRRIEFSPTLFEKADQFAGYTPGVFAHEFGHIVGCNREGRFTDWAPQSFWDEFGGISDGAPPGHFADCFALAIVPTYPADTYGDYGCPSQEWADLAKQEASLPRNPPSVRAGGSVEPTRTVVDSFR